MSTATAATPSRQDSVGKIKEKLLSQLARSAQEVVEQLKYWQYSVKDPSERGDIYQAFSEILPKVTESDAQCGRNLAILLLGQQAPNDQLEKTVIQHALKAIPKEGRLAEESALLVQRLLDVLSKKTGRADESDQLHAQILDAGIRTMDFALQQLHQYGRNRLPTQVVEQAALYGDNNLFDRAVLQLAQSLRSFDKDMGQLSPSDILAPLGTREDDKVHWVDQNDPWQRLPEKTQDEFEQALAHFLVSNVEAHKSYHKSYNAVELLKNIFHANGFVATRVIEKAIKRAPDISNEIIAISQDPNTPGLRAVAIGAALGALPVLVERAREKGKDENLFQVIKGIGLVAVGRNILEDWEIAAREVYISPQFSTTSSPLIFHSDNRGTSPVLREKLQEPWYEAMLVQLYERVKWGSWHSLYKRAERHMRQEAPNAPSISDLVAERIGFKDAIRPITPPAPIAQPANAAT